MIVSDSFVKKVPPHIGDRYHEQSADYKDQGADTVIVGYESGPPA